MGRRVWVLGAVVGVARGSIVRRRSERRVVMVGSGVEVLMMDVGRQSDSSCGFTSFNFKFEC